MYPVAGKKKAVTVGKVAAVSAAEATVVHKPVTDNHLRLSWRPMYVEDGQEVLGSGSNPSKETLPINRVLFPAQVNDGVLAYAAARRLDQSNSRYERGTLDTVDNVDIEAMLPERSAKDESMCRMVERFCGAGQGNIRCPAIDDDSSNRIGGVSKHPVTFEKHSELQRWLRLGMVDFAEIFRGYGELTRRVTETGCSASEGFDKYAVTFERCWCLPRMINAIAPGSWLTAFARK